MVLVAKSPANNKPGLATARQSGKIKQMRKPVPNPCVSALTYPEGTLNLMPCLSLLAVASRVGNSSGFKGPWGPAGRARPAHGAPP